MYCAKLIVSSPFRSAAIGMKGAVARARYYPLRQTPSRALSTIPSLPFSSDGGESTLRLPHPSTSQQKGIPSADANSPAAMMQRLMTVVVGPLTPETGAARLMDVFGACGVIYPPRLLNGRGTGLQPRFAYLSFKSARGVDSALELDRTIVDGHTIYVRALFRHLDRVLVRGLEPHTDESKLRAVFGKCGVITSVSIRHRRARETFVAYIHFETPAMARRAVKLSGTRLDGNRISVELLCSNTVNLIYRDMTGQASSPPQVLVRHIPPQMNDRWLKETFEHCGEVVRARIQRHLSWDGRVGTGNSLGFGYVEFASLGAVEKALKLNGLRVAGQSLSVELRQGLSFVHRPRYIHSGAPDPTAVWVSGLTSDVDDARLFSEFKRFGEIVKARVVVDYKLRKSRGYAFVTFAAPASVEAVLQHDGMEIDGFSIKIRRAILPHKLQ